MGQWKPEENQRDGSMRKTGSNVVGSKDRGRGHEARNVINRWSLKLEKAKKFKKYF